MRERQPANVSESRNACFGSVWEIAWFANQARFFGCSHFRLVRERFQSNKVTYVISADPASTKLVSLYSLPFSQHHMRASASKVYSTHPVLLPPVHRIRLISTSAGTLSASPFHQQATSFNLGVQNPLGKAFHTTAPASKLRRQWLKRGMRGRIQAWAGSLGLADGQASGSSTEAPVGEELYVMPGWAVPKVREKAESGETLDGQPGSLLSTLRLSNLERSLTLSAL